MLYYDRTDVSEGIHVNKTSLSKECDICNYWYFLDKGFKFQLYVCNGYHDLLLMSTSLEDMAFLNICGVDDRCNIYGISKSDAVNFLQNDDLTNKIVIL